MNLFDTLGGAVQTGTTLVFSPLLRSWYNRWGATAEETAEPLPGDDLVPQFLMGYTHAITIQAPPECVWPWLVQLGQGRGGMYSFEGLENLIGCKMTNVDTVKPELQNPRIGEVIRMGPQGYPCFVVMSIDASRSFILISANPKTDQAVAFEPHPEKGYSIATWQFVLKPLPQGGTRLITRQRLAYSQDMKVIWRLTEPIGFVMERKMLRSIKRLAEKLSGQKTQ